MAPHALLGSSGYHSYLIPTKIHNYGSDIPRSWCAPQTKRVWTLSPITNTLSPNDLSPSSLLSASVDCVSYIFITFQSISSNTQSSSSLSTQGSTQGRLMLRIWPGHLFLSNQHTGTSWTAAPCSQRSHADCRGPGSTPLLVTSLCPQPEMFSVRGGQTFKKVLKMQPWIHQKIASSSHK